MTAHVPAAGKPGRWRVNPAAGSHRNISGTAELTAFATPVRVLPHRSLPGAIFPPIIWLELAQRCWHYISYKWVYACTNLHETTLYTALIYTILTSLLIGDFCRFCLPPKFLQLLITGKTISHSKFIQINLAAKIANNIKRS